MSLDSLLQRTDIWRGGVAALVVGAVGDVGVHVDQAGQHGLARPVDRGRPVAIARPRP